MRTAILSALLAVSVAGPVVAAPPPPSTAPLAAFSWDWGEFWKYWRRQGGKTSGVLGLVTLTVLLGALIIMSAKKKT